MNFSRDSLSALRVGTAARLGPSVPPSFRAVRSDDILFDASRSTQVSTGSSLVSFGFPLLVSQGCKWTAIQPRCPCRGNPRSSLVPLSSLLQHVFASRQPYRVEGPARSLCSGSISRILQAGRLQYVSFLPCQGIERATICFRMQRSAGVQIDLDTLASGPVAPQPHLQDPGFVELLGL